MRTTTLTGHETWLGAAAVLASGVVTSILLWLGNRLVGKAAFQTALNNGFSGLARQLQEENALLRKQLKEERVNREVDRVERARLRGEIDNLLQTVESLKSLMRRNGLEVPMRHIQPEAGDIVYLEKRDDTDKK